MIPSICLILFSLFVSCPAQENFHHNFGGFDNHFGGRPKLFHGDATYGHRLEGFGPGFGLGHFGGPKFIGGSELGQNHFSEGSRGLNGNISTIPMGESAHFFDTDGGKKEHQDGKSYYEGQHFGKEGKSGAENSAKQGHRKGHRVKGFSTHHHKDEAEKTEEFFDEAHDVGGNVAFHGQSGKFGETGASSHKGEHLDGKFNTGESKKGVHYDKEFVDGKVHSNQGHFGDKKYSGHGATQGEHKFIRGKPIRFGYKIWSLNTKDGCLANSELYQGKGPNVNTDYEKLFGKAASPLVVLLDEMPQEKKQLPYKFYVDNLFSGAKKIPRPKVIKKNSWEEMVLAPDMLDVAMQNSWILYNKTRRQKISQLEFKREVVNVYSRKNRVLPKGAGRPSSS
ncbi:hypothetical protein JTB14_024314 [Gonioctena quinquepunctata]|nr:hypothetical protein JTB14_024314 [Gonioctena quinquepunctata]